MDLQGDYVIALILLLLEVVELGKMRDETRDMEEQLRADRAAMEAKENERLMLMRERDHMLELKKATDKLVADFLQADDNNNFDAQKAMKNEIVALMTTAGGDGSNTGGYVGGVNGEQTERAEIVTIEEKNSDGE